jgi:hypothetical protein
MSRLGPSFHRTFALNRPAILQILRLVKDYQARAVTGRVLNFELIAEGTSLGPVYIAAMRRYAFACGLLDKQERLTELGDCVLAHDPNLQAPATCWAMHYHLSSPQGVGPSFWADLVKNRLRCGDELDRTALAKFVQETSPSNSGEAVSAQIASQAATVFLGTYSKSDALGPLGFLEQAESGSYSVKEPNQPSLHVFAYVLADYWRANWGDVVGVNIGRLSEPGSPGALLLMGSGSINRYLGELQTAGFAVVQRRTPPFQVNRNWSNPAQFLEKLYD